MPDDEKKARVDALVPGQRVYANAMAYRSLPGEIVVDFYAKLPNSDLLGVGGVILTPHFLKGLIGHLIAIVVDYERRFGALPTPEDLQGAEEKQAEVLDLRKIPVPPETN